MPRPLNAWPEPRPRSAALPVPGIALCWLAVAAFVTASATIGFEDPGIMRHEVTVSGGAVKDERLPLVIVLHGRGDRPHVERFARRSERVRWAIPYAPMPAGAGFSWFPYFREGDREMPRRVQRQRDRLLRFTQQVMKAYPTEGERAVVIGVSQGGVLAYALAAKAPERYRAAVAFMGLLPPGMLPRTHGSTRIWALHGTSDEVMPFSAGERAVTAFRDLGYPVHFESVEGGTHSFGPAFGQAFGRAVADVL